MMGPSVGTSVADTKWTPSRVIAALIMIMWLVWSTVFAVRTTILAKNNHFGSAVSFDNVFIVWVRFAIQAAAVLPAVLSSKSSNSAFIPLPQTPDYAVSLMPCITAFFLLLSLNDGNDSH